MKLFFITIVCLFLSQIAFTQTSCLQNYSPDMYKAASQNWEVTQDSTGILYFANSDGVLKFDGVNWNIIRLPKVSTIFCIKSNHRNRIYTGGRETMGYLTQNKLDFKGYVSLNEKLPAELQSFGRVKYIFLQDSKVIFIASRLLLIYHEKTDILEHIPVEIKKAFKLNQQIILQINKKYHQLQGNKIIPFPSFEGLNATTSIIEAFSLDTYNYLIVTRSKGIFIYNSKTQEKIPFNSSLNMFLENHKIKTIQQVSQKRFVITLKYFGLIIINSEGNILQYITQSEGLISNYILNVFEDSYQNLWLANNFGITQVILKSPFTFFETQKSWTGKILSLARHNGITYLGTNEGLFYKDGDVFKLIDTTKGDKVWNFKKIHNQLYIAHSKGIFVVDSSNARKIIQRRVRVLGTLKKHPEVILCSISVEGLWIVRKQGNKWVETQIKGFDKNIRYIEEDQQGNLWASSHDSGIYRLKLDKSLNYAIDVRYYQQKEGLPSDKNNRVFKLKNGQVLFTTQNGIYQYNRKKDIFEPNPRFQKTIGNGCNCILYPTFARPPFS